MLYSSMPNLNGGLCKPLLNYLTTFSSTTASEVVKIMMYSAFSYENFIKMTCPLQCKKWHFSTPATGFSFLHYSGVIMSAMVFQITDVSIVCSAVCSPADQRKHQSSASPAFVRRIHWWLVDSPHRGSVIFDYVIMKKIPFNMLKEIWANKVNEKLYTMLAFHMMTFNWC